MTCYLLVSRRSIVGLIKNISTGKMKEEGFIVFSNSVGVPISQRQKK